MALADLADEVATRETEIGDGRVSIEEVKHIYLMLYHAHIPKMDEAGIVEYNQAKKTVALAENADQLLDF